MATKTKPENLIDLIIARAPELHAAGVTSLSMDGIAVTLVRPPEKPSALPPPKEQPQQHIDPLKDSSTYPGGRIPSFKREDEF